MDAAPLSRHLRDRQFARFHAAGDAQRQTIVDDANRDRQAGNADPDHDGGYEIHHRQSDLERTAVDRPSRIPSGAGAGSDGARSHGFAGRLRPRRRPYLAATWRQECAWPDSLQFPEQIPRLPARHAGQIHVRLRQAGFQPWLHARARSGTLCRSAVVAGAPGRRLHRGAHQENVRSERDRYPVPDLHSGQPDLSNRFCRRCRQA